MTDFRAFRARLGVSQAAAARIFRVTDTTWQNWEYGKTAPGPAMVLAEVLDNDRRVRRRLLKLDADRATVTAQVTWDLDKSSPADSCS